jgi:hypothetical protein
MFDFLKRKLKVKEAPEEFFEDVKKQGENVGSLVPFGTNLEFDPATGQFKTTAKLAGSGDGDIVTEMTEKGFA